MTLAFRPARDQFSAAIGAFAFGLPPLVQRLDRIRVHFKVPPTPGSPWDGLTTTDATEPERDPGLVPLSPSCGRPFDGLVVDIHVVVAEVRAATALLAADGA